jgi:membrane-bound lytic murein transglycosylase D
MLIFGARWLGPVRSDVHGGSVTRANRWDGCSFRACTWRLVALTLSTYLCGRQAAAEPAGGIAKTARATPGGGGKSGEENLSQRRAVRGSRVDEGSESPELGELRRFEEQAFPRNNTGSGSTADSDAVVDVAPSLPGRWSGTGDVPEVLRAPETTPTPSQAPPAPDSDWLRSLRLPELPVRWDPQVLRYLEYFKNDPRGRAVMGNWLRRAGRYRSLYTAVLEREGLPRDLFYVAMVESGFEAGARSPVGAGGIWQFMPGAARAYGLEVGYWVDARRDPERSVEAAARYLKDLYVRFGSWHLVFAAYNAGYGAVLKSITRYNTNDYWELCHHEAGLPWESSLYVPKILAAAIVGHNLEVFGYADIVPDPPFAYDKVDVPPGTGLATVARATRTKPEVIAALNPHLLRDRTPPDRSRTELRIPVGSEALFAEGFDRSRGPGDRLETLVLRFGETLDEVAKSRGTTARELRRLNSVKDSGELRAGIAILVPPKTPRKGAKLSSATASTGPLPATTAAATMAPEREGPTVAISDVGDDDEILVAVPDRVFNYEGRERVFYRTRDGDTLEDIADAVGVRPEDLVDWNNLDATAKLHPKMVLQIFVRKDFDSSQIVLLDPAHIRVVTLGSQEFLELEAARRGKKRLVVEARSGDTLSRLGRRYGLTTGDLARINRFSYNTELEAGQKVVVYSPVGDNPREVARGLSAEPRRDRAVVALARGGFPKPVDKVVDRGVDRGSVRPGVKSSAKSGESSPARGKPVTPNTARATAARRTGPSTRGDRSLDKIGEASGPRGPGKSLISRPAPKKK